MARLGNGFGTIVFAGLVTAGVLAGAAGWLALTRAESVLGWSFDSGIRTVAADWGSALPGAVLLDTLAQSNAARVPTPVSHTPATAVPLVLPYPVRGLATGDFISVGTSGGKIAVLEVVDVRPIDRASLGMTAKPGAPQFMMIVCRDADHPNGPAVRLLVEVAPEAAPAPPTRS